MKGKHQSSITWLTLLPSLPPSCPSLPPLPPSPSTLPLPPMTKHGIIYSHLVTCSLLPSALHSHLCPLPHLYTPLHTCTCVYLVTHEFVCLDGLHEGDGVRVQLIGLVGLVHYGEWHSEIEPLEITNLQTHTYTQCTVEPIYTSISQCACENHCLCIRKIPHGPLKVVPPKVKARAKGNARSRLGIYTHTCSFTL